MLIVQIALGIVLGFLILRYLPQLLKISLWLFILALVITALFLLWEFKDEILSFASKSFVFILGLIGAILYLGLLYLSGVGIYNLVLRYNKKFTESETTPNTWCIAFAVINCAIIIIVYENVPPFSSISNWSRVNEPYGIIDGFIMSILFLWAWVPELPNIRRKGAMKYYQLLKRKLKL